MQHRRHDDRVETTRLDRRNVSARLTLSIGSPADIVMAIAVADGVERVDETLVVELDGKPIDTKVIQASHGSRLHQLRDVTAGWLTVSYEASVIGAADPAPVGDETAAAPVPLPGAFWLMATGLFCFLGVRR